MRSKEIENAIERLKNGKNTAYFGSNTAIYFIKDVDTLLAYIEELENARSPYFIPKAIIRNKIKEYESKRQELYNKELWNEPVDTILNNRYVNYINVLNELLEGE